ncbi:MAG: SMP-30/gluconolactonase/LRE family protein [Planctomycetes bacterium]|nr:SMP-30/gluconolactonase/LRE family protein [Planctomycetota bacterium]
MAGIIGSTGSGPGEFVYPRAIDISPDGGIYVADKTGRIQKLAPDGKALNVIRLPLIEAGKPVGLSVGPDGRLYVPDTHYHRVLIYDAGGKLAQEFGRHGTEPGCFIYPTDISFFPADAAGFAKDGRILVGEYGGNDRISVFDTGGKYLFSFGSLGEGEGQFSRPQSLCYDPAISTLYVADACNHRIARYELTGGRLGLPPRLAGYFGSAGEQAGQLRYPYGLALRAGGQLAVCEYGNNRVQIFNRDGSSAGIFGKPGRQTGELAFPWAVAFAPNGNAFIIDSGNNRIQIWKLP